MEQRITSRKNPQLLRVKKLLASRSFREQEGRFVSDGTKLLAEAVRFCPGLETVILSDGVEAEVPEGAALIRVPEDVMASLSPMAAPQGALFVGKVPEQGTFMPVPGMLLLDGIQDPGNVGTILRTADALGVPVALLEGCADPYSHKVIRASMGAVFRTPPVSIVWAEAKAALDRAGIPVAATAMDDRAESLRESHPGALAVVIGSEGQGVRPEILRSAAKTLIIPMSPNCESLNAAVAASIVMWQMNKLR